MPTKKVPAPQPEGDLLQPDNLERHLAEALARWERLMVDRAAHEHSYETPAPIEVSRALWGATVEVLVVAAAMARQSGRNEAAVPYVVLEWAASRLHAALMGRPEPALRRPRGGKASSPDEALGQRLAVEYVQLADEGFLTDEHARTSVRKIFARPGTRERLLDDHVWRRWKKQHHPDGRLQREVLEAEAAGAADRDGRTDRASLARAILERWAVKMRVRH